MKQSEIVVGGKYSNGFGIIRLVENLPGYARKELTYTCISKSPGAPYKVGRRYCSTLRAFASWAKEVVK